MKVGRGEILYLHVHIAALTVGVVTIGGEEGIACSVEDVKEALMEGQTSPENGAYDDVLYKGHAHLAGSQRSLYLPFLRLQRLAYLVRHETAYARDILAKAHAVLLYFPVAQFGYKLIDDGVFFSQIDYFHSFMFLRLHFFFSVE